MVIHREGRDGCLIARWETCCVALRCRGAVGKCGRARWRERTESAVALLTAASEALLRRRRRGCGAPRTQNTAAAFHFPKGGKRCMGEVEMKIQRWGKVLVDGKSKLPQRDHIG